MEANYICPKCHKRTRIDKETYYKCECGGAFELEKIIKKLPVENLRDRIGSIWRYREAIPIENDNNIVSLGEGITPLIQENISGKRVLLKLDYLFPTGSYKDRGASVLVSKMKELGVRTAIEDSSGNAGAAIAAYCAKAGVSCEIFCPEGSSEEKLIQISSYGAKVVRIPGSREETAIAVKKRLKELFYASHNWNPYFLEGTKTVFYEICEQLHWKTPDSIIIPVGYGSIILGIAIGIRELKNMGVIDKIPRLIAVQSEACSPIYKAFIEGKDEVTPLYNCKHTYAEGIACANPVRGGEILKIVRETDGEIVAVSEKEIIEGVKVLLRKGIYVEPTSAVIVGGLAKSAKVKKEEVNTAILTGSGLKSTVHY
ncbi:MAG: threonine synthase [Candidatus Aerophobetes bacterium]|nr:threonine synthase [Candidatus Aerophobetes bacterium]